jgi:Zn-dependent peptidase ImmA (M78 family)/transcriptional regulator with XRE-family HTH domain
MSKINPERLKEIRIVRKLNLSQLADKIGITKQAISNYEHEKSMPSPEIFSKMINILGISKNYLTKDAIELKEVTTSLFFRATSITTETDHTFASIICKWCYEIILGINSFENIPKINLPDFNWKLTIPEKAAYLRHFWNLGNTPINNVISILEANGIFVFIVNSSELHTDAYSQIINGVPIIILNEHKGTAVRWRFNLCHELGHLILHKNMSTTEFELKADIIEKEASLFASCFLMPAESFGSSIITTRLESFLELKKEWKVSIAAMLYNCEYIGLIDKNKYTALQKQLSKKGWRKNEPFDDEFEFEKPMYFYKQAQKHLIDKNNFDRFNNLVRLPISYIERLSSLPDGYFSKYNNGLIDDDVLIDDYQLNLFEQMKE